MFLIDLNFIFSLITFYFVMYVTPGPNNAMVLASGLKFGFLRTVPHMSGITLGHIFQLIIVCLGFGKIFQVFPELQVFLKILCAIYLLFLAYKVLGSFNYKKDEKIRPLKFYEGALFQIVNPKAWTISSIAASSFLNVDQNLIFTIVLLAVVALVMCPLSISPWAIFGATIRKNIANQVIKRIIECFLAFLLLITSLLILIS